MPSLTLSMIVKNEEKYLQECLDSVKDIAGEIVVVDTGSTDRTIEIAERAGARVYNFDWVNDFSAARNYALSKSTGDWILYLDADERLSQKSHKELKSIISSKKKEAYFCIVNSIGSAAQKSNKMRYARLFRNEKSIKFSGSIHEQIIHSLQNEGYLLKDSDIEIIHLGYDISYEGLKEKARRNLSYLLNEYERKKDPYTVFQLAQTYAVLNDKPNAAKYFSEVLNYNCPDFYRAHSLRYLASCELEKNNLASARRLAERGLGTDSTQPLLHYVMARILMRQREYEKAIEHTLQAFRCNNNQVKKDFEIYVDNKAVINLGIQAAIMARDPLKFDSFLDLLKKEEAGAGSSPLLSFIGKIMQGVRLSPSEVQYYASIADETNIETVFLILDGYAEMDVRLELLRRMPEGIKTNTEFEAEYLNALGAALLKSNLNEEAGEAFEASIKKGIKDPSAIFFLISVYINTGKFERILPLVETAERMFCSDNEVMQRVRLLKEQLTAL
ncbi:MAG: glycosyltransferase [Ignavibacteria bacterium]|nr:glycosyltransferase [Ignavibacteria bacterium]MCU7500885.1 glycosyltransferase [Ignavibacteria bacterium]MCU7518459.1 glycosyltransferase [Ignavibacteria bacterium]